MAIVNRDLEVSQQKDVVGVNIGSLATGLTLVGWVAPYPCTIQSMKHAAISVSNAMQLDFAVQRGITVVALGISNLILQNVGTSGSVSYSGLAAAGSTLLNLAAGDALIVHSSVANGNALSIALQMVVKKTQDIVSYN